MNIDRVLTMRGKSYGTFEENARISQLLKARFREELNYGEIPPVVREGLDMIAAKLCRILSVPHGWEHEDNWVDLAGYSTLVQQYIQKEKMKGSSSQNSPSG